MMLVALRGMGRRTSRVDAAFKAVILSGASLLRMTDLEAAFGR